MGRGLLRCYVVPALCLGLSALVFACGGDEALEVDVPSVFSLEVDLLPVSAEMGVGNGSSEAAADDLVYDPSGVAIASSGEVFVMDGGNQRIAVFDLEGKFLREIGGPGQGPGEFGQRSQGSLTLSDDGRHIYVLESTRGRLTVLTASGEHVRFVRPALWPISFAVRGEEFIFIGVPPDASSPLITEYGVEGREIAAYGRAVATTIEEGYLNVARVAASPARVKAAFLAWPLICDFADQGDCIESWLTFGWISDDDLRARYERPRALLDEPNLDPLSNPEMRPLVFRDLIYNPTTGFWYALLAGGHVQVLTDDNETVAAWQLSQSPAEEAGSPTHLAVSPDGGSLCATFSNVARVLCYDVNGVTPDRR